MVIEMTAINIICQPRHRCVHVVTDGAHYTIPDGIVFGVGPKMLPVPHWPGVVTGRGSSVALAVLSMELSQIFQSFDEVVAGIESELPEIMDRFNFTKQFELIIAGLSSSRDHPESYVIHPTDEAAPGAIDAAKALEGTGLLTYEHPEPFKLIRLADAIQGPALTLPMLKACGFGFDQSFTPEDALTYLDNVIEAQRHDIQPGAEGYFVGGLVQLATVTSTGIEQRIIRRWNEDKIGQPISPLPIDWKKWRAERESANVAALVPEGLSRLQRTRMEKKARKGTLRAV
jgi:hypothetical protein